MIHSVLRRLPLLCLALVCPFLLTVVTTSAFADTLITYWSTANISNAQNYDPVSGNIYASVIGTGSSQVIQAENWYVYWDAGRLSSLQNQGFSNLGPTFHAFYYSNSCQLPYTFDGNYETNISGSIYAKPAHCSIFGVNNNINNEARFYWPTGSVQSYTLQYGGAEFAAQSSISTANNTAKVSNDIYYNDGSVKHNISNGTWCFDGGSTAPHGC